MYTKFIIEKGDHYCTPKVNKIFIGRQFNVKWKFKIDGNLKYDLNNHNQYDWNKLFGMTFFNVIPNDDNSIRIGYRYITRTDTHELTIYYHVNGVFNTDKIIQLNGTSSYELIANIKYSNKRSTVILTDLENKALLVENRNWNANYMFAYENNFYFGGNDPAPNTMTLQKYRL